MDNEFLKHPIHLNIIGVNLRSEPHYYLKQLIVYVGNVPNEIIKEIRGLNLEKISKNKILESYYGPNWNKLLGLDKTLDRYIGSNEDDIFDIESELLGIAPEAEKKLK